MQIRTTFPASHEPQDRFPLEQRPSGFAKTQVRSLRINNPTNRLARNCTKTQASAFGTRVHRFR